MVRALANGGRRPAICFYRDHQGHEVDFLIPVGEKLKLMECKWSESGFRGRTGFDILEKAAGAESILSRSVVTPVRGRRMLDRGRLVMQDCVEFQDL